MAGELDSCKLLSGLLSGLAQKDFHGHPGITEELLRSQIYPEVPPEEFRPFLAKMRGILKRAEKGGRKKGRVTSMCERNIYWLPLACLHLGTWIATQECVLTKD